MRRLQRRFALLVTLVAVGCHDRSTAPELASSVTIQPAIDTLVQLGAVKTLSAVAFRRNGARLNDAIVQWSSTNDAVATVSGSGQVTAISPGTVEIIARVDGVQARATIVVRQRVAQLTLSAPADTLDSIGKEMQLTLGAADGGNAAIAAPEVTWTSSDSTIIRVNAAGIVTALRAGTAEISAVAGAVSARKSLTVYVFGAARVRVMLRGGGRVASSFKVGLDFNFNDMRGDTTFVVTRLLNGAHVTSVTGLPDHCMGTPAQDTFSTAPGDTTTVTVRIRCVGQYAYLNLTSTATEELRYMDAFGVSSRLASDVVIYSTAWSPDGQRIAYARRIADQSDIYVLDPATRVETRLTNHPDDDVNPTWSPDGRFIAYANVRFDGSGSVDVIAADGTTNRHLFAFAQRSSGPYWSPASDQIVVVARNQETNTGLWSIRPSDGWATRLISPNARESSPAWSRDGQKLAFVSSNAMDTTWTLIVANADGSAAYDVARRVGNVSWSPDNSTLLVMGSTAVNGSFRIGRVSVSGGVPVMLTPELFYFANDPTWHDDDTVLFSGGPFNVGIMAMDPDGSFKQDLVRTELLQTEPLPRPR